MANRIGAGQILGTGGLTTASIALRAWFLRVAFRRRSARRLRALKLAVALAVISGASAPTIAAPNIHAGARIGSIAIRGNRRISTTAIDQILKQRLGDPFDNANAEADRKAIRSMGYFRAVTDQFDTEPHSSVVAETYTVVENPVVSRIDFKGNTVFSTSRLLALMRVHMGHVLNLYDLESDIQAINRYYHQQGFSSWISTDINIDSTTGVLTVPVIEFRVASIRITVNKNVPTARILGLMRTKVGSIYEVNMLRSDLTRVYASGLFAGVGPAQASCPRVGQVKLTIPVDER